MNTRWSTWIGTWAGVIAAWLGACVSGCGRVPLEGPPELRLGRDECAECGMLISEDRCSCAMLLELDGERRYVLFDDVGCLLDHARSRLDGARVSGVFTHEYGTRAWMDGRTCAFVLSDGLRAATPMGSGIVALRDTAAASQLREREGGVTHTFETLGPARQAWLAARYHAAQR